MMRIVHTVGKKSEARRRRLAGWAVAMSMTVVALAQSAPAQTEGASAEVLAQVGTRTITVADFEAEVARRSPNGAHYVTLAQRNQLLDEMVRLELIVEKAIEEGYDRDPEFRAAVDRILASRYTEDHLDRRLEGLAVSDAEIRREFEMNRSRYSRPERVKGAIIFLEVGPRATEEEIAALQQEAQELREAATLMTDVNHLGALAQQHSDDRATRYLGGVLPWLTIDSDTKWGPEVVNALFAIEEIGGVGPVVRTDAGFYVVRLVDREGGEELPYEMYAAGIRRQLLRERQNAEREAFYLELENDVEITVNRERLTSVPGLQPDADESEPPAPPALPGQ